MLFPSMVLCLEINHCVQAHHRHRRAVLYMSYYISVLLTVFCMYYFLYGNHFATAKSDLVSAASGELPLDFGAREL